MAHFSKGREGVCFLLLSVHYGVPEDIVSDRGSQFTSMVWRAFMERLGVSVSLTSGFHPDRNGQGERVTQDVGRFLRSLLPEPAGGVVGFHPLGRDGPKLPPPLLH